MTILQSSIAPPTGGYQISRSLRFNSADSAYLNRTLSSSNQKTWTWSGWVKRTSLADSDLFTAKFTGGGYPNASFSFDTNVIRFWAYTGSAFRCNKYTTQVFRDVGAWYHLVFAIDTTNGTAEDRVKMYVNGVRITAFSTNTNPSLNDDLYINGNTNHAIGGQAAGGYGYFNGYMTEINFIDGQALTPSSFGQSDPNTGVWSPIKYTGTYGTNGFYLNFSDNSNTTAATLGKDSSGNGNNWTPNGFSVTAGAGDDSVVDTPTSYGTNTGAGGEVRGNYATRNPLAASTTATGYITNGNLDAVWSSGGSFDSATTMGFDATDATGYYWEYLVNGTALSIYPFVGIANSDAVIAFTGKSGGSNQPGTTSGGWMFRNASGNKFNNDSATSYGTATTSGWGCVAVKNGKIFIGSISGGTITWKNSGNPITEANPMFSGITGTVFPVTSEYSSGTVSYNFGQKPFQATAPSGFKALCTQNLPTPTIGATSTTQAGKYFNPVLYTGNGSTQSITGVGFQPDWVWIKSRSSSGNHSETDAVRGVNKQLFPNLTDAEGSQTDQVTAFNSDGFSLGANAAGTGSVNVNTVTYVAWNWKANGSGSSNTAGTITSTVSANTTAGFSIVTYTGNGSAGTKVGHGLGVAPSMMIVKQRGSAGTNWAVYHASLPSAFGVAGTQVIYLNATTANTQDFNVWDSNNTEATRFSVGASTLSNANTGTYVAYCFAAVAGYSAFGSYTGNGSTDGPFVYTGFRPRYLFWKRSNSTGSWGVYDTTRSTYNQVRDGLLFESSAAEFTYDAFDILSNGFKVRASGAGTNGSGDTHIFGAFAESPFKYALAR